MLEDTTAGDLSFYHFAVLRQALEVIALFLGKPYLGYVLQQIEVENPDEVVKVINFIQP